MRQHASLTAFAKEMRRNPTPAERRIWSLLRRKQMDGFKFRRQAVLGPFVVDFVCLQRRLIIEVDGGQHADSIYDARRDAWLESKGFRVLRLWNSYALDHDDEGLCRTILSALAQGPSPLAGEGGTRPSEAKRAGG